MAESQDLGTGIKEATVAKSNQREGFGGVFWGVMDFYLFHCTEARNECSNSGRKCGRSKRGKSIAIAIFGKPPPGKLRTRLEFHGCLNPILVMRLLSFVMSNSFPRPDMSSSMFLNFHTIFYCPE